MHRGDDPGERAPPGRALGVRLIVLYKAIKAVAEVLLGVLIVVLAATGALSDVRDLAVHLREHVASRWSLLAGRALGAVFSTRGVHLLEVGLALDGLLSAVEGWSLWRGYRWGPWLVVAATGTPLPLEMAELARTHRISRAVALAVNLAVDVYPARRIRSERRAATVARGPRR